ncbi:MAG: MepB family protein [Flavobacterium sp.]
MLIPDFLVETKLLYFDKNTLVIRAITIEKESAAYNACQLLFDDKKMLFRTAKTTPTKIGQFVTLWKRIKNGPIAPFDDTDNINAVIIQTKVNNRSGLFVFPVAVLIEKGIISTDKKEGKRAIRVYPSWDKTISKQAQKSQEWQLDYFLEIPSSI